MIRIASLVIAALLVMVLTACATSRTNTQSSIQDMSCPSDNQVKSAYGTAGQVSEMPGSESLNKGIVLLDQGRYAAAYASFRDAIDRGLPDAIERAQTYRNMGLLMCRLDSAEACQRNLEMAFFTGGSFELSSHDLQLPHAQTAYEGARQQFLSRCASVAASTKVQTGTRQKAAFPEKEPAQIALVLVDPAKRKSRMIRDATLLLHVKPWARVSIDYGADVITPPAKTIKIRPGKRTISISHPDFEPVIIEGNFRAGQTWLLRQVY